MKNDCRRNVQRTKTKWEDIPEYGDLFTMSKFISLCEVRGFINYDGFGNLATETKMSEIEIKPSDIIEKIKIDKQFTHVVWFNIDRQKRRISRNDIF